MQSSYVIGLHSVETVLQSFPERIKKILVKEGEERGKKSALITLCQKHRISIQKVKGDFLTKLVNTDSHQGFVAECIEREYTHLKDFFSDQEDKNSSLVLMMDQIFDPHNVGAILRSCECFGVDAVVFSKNRGSEITPVVTKTSTGASELLSLIRVSNLAETVSQFQKEGYTVVVSLLDKQAIDLSTYSFPEKTLLVMGSEGEGVQPLIQKRADAKIYIPMKGHIQSLNVAQATATILYQISGKS